MRFLSLVLAASLTAACGQKAPPAPPASGPSAAEIAACHEGKPMRVRFYDVAQGLAALVTLPDGQEILVDTGDASNRRGCGLSCAEANRHLLTGLARDVGPSPISLLWLTHPHSDHVGGAIDVVHHFKVLTYVDNGKDLLKPQIEKPRIEAEARAAEIDVVDPSHRVFALKPPVGVKVTAIPPAHWPPNCDDDPNECSIALRIDYCQSSVLFVGDAEKAEEELLDVAPATLLQVGHHGSDTSSSEAFLAKVAPHYAVISSGKPGVGMNAEYCHPRKDVVERLTTTLGGPTRALKAFDGAVACKESTPAHWIDTPASERLWSTARDGDVFLLTNGDGTFHREEPPEPPKKAPPADPATETE